MLLVIVVITVAIGFFVPVTVVLAAVVLGVTSALRQRGRRHRRRRSDEGRALETALDVLVGELNVGAHPVQAFTVAAAESGGTVGESFRAVAARARLGADVPAGLHSVAAASALSTQWDRLAVTWQLAADHGLTMSTLMRAAQRDIIARQRFSARVTVGMAGARTTAAILAGLPALGVLLGQMLGADPVGFLLGGGTGGWLLVVGVSLACCGLRWADHITDRLLP
jgi:tight adherence protein B